MKALEGGYNFMLCLSHIHCQKHVLYGTLVSDTPCTVIKKQLKCTEVCMFGNIHLEQWLCSSC